MEVGRGIRVIVNPGFCSLRMVYSGCPDIRASGAALVWATARSGAAEDLDDHPEIAVQVRDPGAAELTAGA
jgi:hypothetical protein